MIASFNEITQTRKKLKISQKHLLQVHRGFFPDISKETCDETNQLH